MAEVVTWTWNTRQPTASDPLVIDVGPGEFGPFSCTNAGYVTIRGNGRDNTIIAQQGAQGAVTVENCTRLSFQNLAIKGDEFGYSSAAIYWFEGGDSTWSDVDVFSGGGTASVSYSWWDECTGSGEKSLHYWFGSRLIGQGGWYHTTMFTACSETWFYGGEVAAIGNPNSPNSNFLQHTAVWVLSRGDFRAFGTAIRSTDGGANKTIFNGGGRLGLQGVIVGNFDSYTNLGPEGGDFHMHGGIINTNGSNTSGDSDVFALHVDDVADAHVVDTAFSVKASGTGTGHRISGSKAQSPYQWPPGSNPPQIGSVHGADMFVETDCDGTGDCEGAGTETHVMVYNASCTVTGPWFDSTTGRCRGDIAP
jgi:hypothetical protein